MTKEERKEYGAIYRSINKDRIKAYNLSYRSKNKDQIKALRLKVKETKKAYDLAYRLANFNKKKAYDKNYQEKNAQKIKDYKYKYRLLNPDKINAYFRAYQKQRSATDPVFAMGLRLRSRISMVFKVNGYKKRSATQKMLGCSFTKFKDHIEKQFTDGMTWDNRSEWHLDHIIPLSCATTIQGLEKLSHYKHIRPLWAKDNLAKSDNLVLF